MYFLVATPTPAPKATVPETSNVNITIPSVEDALAPAWLMQGLSWYSSLSLALPLRRISFKVLFVISLFIFFYFMFRNAFIIPAVTTC